MNRTATLPLWLAIALVAFDCIVIGVFAFMLLRDWYWRRHWRNQIAKVRAGQNPIPIIDETVFPDDLHPYEEPNAHG